MWCHVTVDLHGDMYWDMFYDMSQYTGGGGGAVYCDRGGHRLWGLMYVQYCDMWAMYCDRSQTVTGGPYTISNSNTMGAYQPYVCSIVDSTLSDCDMWAMYCT